MFLEILLKLINQNGITKNKLLTDLRINHSAVDSWQKRGTVPDGETLLKIADYFDVSVDYLLGKGDQGTTLTKQEQNLIEGFRALNETGKDYILQTLEMAKASYKKSNTASDLEKVVG